MIERGPSLAERVGEWLGDLAGVVAAIVRDRLSIPPYGNTGVIGGTVVERRTGQ